MNKTSALLLPALALALACAKESSAPVSVIGLNVTSESVRSAAGSGISVQWSAGDAIDLFSSDGSSCKCSWSASSGFHTGQGLAGNAEIAVYPSAATNSLSGGVVTLTVPAEQKVSYPGSPAQGANVSVGKVSGKSVALKNVCGLVAFRISGSDVLSVELSASAPLSGQVGATFSGDAPVVKNSSSASRTVKLSPVSSTFKSGLYYLSVLPGAFSSGSISVTCRGGSVRKIDLPSGFTVTRSAVTDFGSIDFNEMPELPAPEPGPVEPDPEEDPLEPKPVEPEPEPTVTLELSLVFRDKNQPFEEALPTSRKFEEKAYHLVKDGTSYEFLIYNELGGYLLNSTGLRFNDGQDDAEKHDGALRFPAVPGLKLKSVTLTTGNANSKTVSICTDRSGDQDAAIATASIPGNGTKTIELSGTEIETSYWLTGGAKNIQYPEITLLYSDL